MSKLDLDTLQNHIQLLEFLHHLQGRKEGIIDRQLQEEQVRIHLLLSKSSSQLLNKVQSHSSLLDEVHLHSSLIKQMKLATKFINQLL